MNVRPRTARGLSPRAFTLVELLIVVAIIAVLAALLLPTLARGKAAAKSAACKSNLRQLGAALHMYVNDFDKYPGNGAIYDADGFAGFFGNGLNWLYPYVGGRYDPDIEQYYSFPSTPTVFNCPAEPPRYLPGLGGALGRTWYNLGYGYNELGSGWRIGAKGGLGLGFTVEVGPHYGGIDQPNQPTSQLSGLRHYVRSGAVRAPSEMVAIGDGGNWLGPNVPGGVLSFTNGTVTAPHSGGANIVLADGHVIYARREAWVGLPGPEWRQWNNDNQPHPETW